MWGILSTKTGTEVVKLTTFSQHHGAPIKITAQTHAFPFLDTPLLGIISTERFKLLQLVRNEGTWQAKLHSFGANGSYDLKMMEGSLQLEVTFTDHQRLDSITYEWQDGEFVEVSQHAPNSLGIPFDEAFNLVETLIFVDQEYATAVPILNAILNELDPDNTLSHLFPEMLYLLGLAHEMQGHEVQAVAAYWQLWHDYPTDPYTLMAAAKLERQ